MSTGGRVAVKLWLGKPLGLLIVLIQLCNPCNACTPSVQACETTSFDCQSALNLLRNTYLTQQLDLCGTVAEKELGSNCTLCVDCSNRGLTSSPCDIPYNTSILLLANNSIHGPLPINPSPLSPSYTSYNGMFATDLMLYVDLSNNQITEISALAIKSYGVIGPYVSSGYLYLHHNNITMIPKNVFGKLGYFELDLSHNQIEEISAGSLSEINIFHLNLSWNLLRSVYGLLFPNVQPTGVDLSHNRLSTIDIGYDNSYPPSSTNFDFSYNQLKGHHGTVNISVLGASEGSLDLSHNMLESIQFTVGFEKLDLSNNELTSVPRHFLESNTRTLDMSYNRITKIEPNALFRFGGVSDTWDLSHNLITGLDASIFPNSQQAEIPSSFIFNNNKIATVEPNLFHRYRTTEVALDLSFNSLTVLNPQFFDGLLLAKEVLLDNNHVSKIDPKWFVGLSFSIETFSMRANPTQCYFSLSSPNIVGCECASGYYGNGRYCVQTGCERNTLENVPHGAFVCGNVTASGHVCPLQCAADRIQSGSDMQCLGDLWGQPTTSGLVVHSLPTCECLPGYVKQGEVCLQPCITSQLPTIPYGAFGCVINSTTGGLSSGSRCPLQCETNRNPSNGVSFLTCLDGKWSQPNTNLTCECPSKFVVASDGRCLDKEPSHTVIIIAATLSCCAVLLGIILFAFRKKFRKTKIELELQRSLLSETRDEVLKLRNVFEIEENDVQLLRRIDGATPGAFGEVWSGMWHGHKVAVKKLHQYLTELDEASVEEFEKEAEFLRTCRHPCIVLFFGAGTWYGGNPEAVPFLVSELMERGALTKVLHDSPKIALDMKISFMRDIARGMEHIHSLGRIHRDLKTHNILVNEQFALKVADFGSLSRLVSRPSGAHDTHGRDQGDIIASTGLLQTRFIGTPVYMAPELLRGSKVYDLTIDVFAFGVVCWQIITQLKPGYDDLCPKRVGFLDRLLQFYESGSRLPLPENTPLGLQTLVATSWETNPADRPTFTSILHTLEDLAL